MLFRYTPGAFMALTDLSLDGKFVTFSAFGPIYVVPLTGVDPLARKAIEFVREEYDAALGHFSPDSRYVAYISNESNNRTEIFVRPFDSNSGVPAGERKWQVTKDGADRIMYWRPGNKEMIFNRRDPQNGDFLVYSVDLAVEPAFQAGTPKLLFRLPASVQAVASLRGSTIDGERFLFVVNADETK